MFIYIAGLDAAITRCSQINDEKIDWLFRRMITRRSFCYFATNRKKPTDNQQAFGQCMNNVSYCINGCIQLALVAHQCVIVVAKCHLTECQLCCDKMLVRLHLRLKLNVVYHLAITSSSHQNVWFRH